MASARSGVDPTSQPGEPHAASTMPNDSMHDRIRCSLSIFEALLSPFDYSDEVNRHER